MNSSLPRARGVAQAGARSAPRGAGASAALRVLLPGEFAFDNSQLSLRTLLGSCVAVTLWHPQRRIGGMCHAILPRGSRRRVGPLDGRYVEDAVELLTDAARSYQTLPGEYQVSLFGGGRMYPVTQPNLDVGARNVALARSLLGERGFMIGDEKVAGGHRMIALDLASGRLQHSHIGANGELRLGAAA